ADHPAGRRHQLAQHLELARGQLERRGRAAVDRDEEAAGLAIEDQVPDFAAVRDAVGAAGQRTQARLHLAQVERLAEVVVRDGVVFDEEDSHVATCGVRRGSVTGFEGPRMSILPATGRHLQPVQWRAMPSATQSSLRTAAAALAFAVSAPATADEIESWNAKF